MSATVINGLLLVGLLTFGPLVIGLFVRAGRGE